MISFKFNNRMSNHDMMLRNQRIYVRLNDILGWGHKFGNIHAPNSNNERCILWCEMILKLSIGYRLICGSDLNKVEVPQNKSSTCDT